MAPSVTLAEAILEFNRKRVFSNPLKGAEIRRITALEAEQIAGLIVLNAGVLPLFHEDQSPPDEQKRNWIVRQAYLAAVIGQESAFSPKAKNLNLKSFGAGVLNYLLGGMALGLGNGDFGIGQLKLKYIRVSVDSPELHGLADREVINRFLFTPAWAVPKVAARYAGLIKWAEKAIPSMEPRWGASLAYNRGQRGAVAAVVAGPGDPVYEAGMKHVVRVQAHYGHFISVLKEA